MHRRPFFALTVCLLLCALFTGCGSTQESAPEPPAFRTTASADDSAADTQTTTAAETTVSSGQKTTGAPPVTSRAASAERAESTTAPRQTFAHSLAVPAADFGGIPVPETYREKYQKNPGDVPARARSAIEEGRVMYGSPGLFCLDRAHGCIFAAMNYSLAPDSLSVYTIHRIDIATGRVTLCGSTAPAWGDTPGKTTPGSSGAFGLICAGGKAFLATYEGFFLADEKTGQLRTLIEKWDPLTGSASICDDKMMISYPEDDPKTGETVYNSYLYDPASDKLKLYQGDRSEFRHRQGVSEFLEENFRTSSLRCEEENGRIRTLIFEWN